MTRKSWIVIATAMLSACAHGPSRPPVEVLRYHLDDPVVVHGTVRIDTPNAGFDSRPFADAVRGQLAGLGLQPIDNGTPDYITSVTVKREPIESYRERPPVTIGIGAGGYSGGWRGGTDIGGGASFGVGKRRIRTIYGTELDVLIRRRSDATLVWEGHARGVTGELKAGDTEMLAGRFVAALFQGFPGESGRTITVK